MNRRHSLLAIALCCGAACSNETNSDSAGLTVELALTAHGVAALRYEVTPIDCDSGEALGPAQTSDVELLDFAAPPVEGLPGFDDGSEHAFTDALFTVAPGCHHVSVTPLDEFGEPSLECSPASQVAQVEAGVTTEILLVSQCNGRDFGALDGVAIVNHPPELENMSLDPSAFVSCGEVQRLCATLTDLDRDRLEFSWTSELTPLVAERTVDGNSVSECVEVVAEQAGDYAVDLTVFDLGLVDGAWTRIEDILAQQGQPQPSRYEMPLAFHAECSASLSAALSYTSTTQQGYCADVEVLNSGAAAAQSWSVQLELVDSKLVAGSGVGATFSVSGSLLTATSPNGSAPLVPGAGTSLHFCGKKAGPHPAAEVVSASAP